MKAFIKTIITASMIILLLGSSMAYAQTIGAAPTVNTKKPTLAQHSEAAPSFLGRSFKVISYPATLPYGFVKNRFTPADSQQDKELLRKIEAIYKEKERTFQKVESPEKKTFFYIIPRPAFIKRTFSKLLKWYNKKDADYNSGSESAKNREHWEQVFGFDVFHPYYKYKEAEKVIKEKCEIKTPKGYKVRPTYKNNQFKVTIIKKF